MVIKNQNRTIITKSRIRHKKFIWEKFIACYELYFINAFFLMWECVNNEQIILELLNAIA